MAKQQKEDVISEEEVKLSDFSWDADKSFFGVETVEKEELEDEDDDKSTKKEQLPDDGDDDEEPPKKEEKVLPGEEEEVDDDDEGEEDDEDDEKKQKSKKKPKEPEPFEDIEEEKEESPTEKDDKFFNVLANELKQAGVFANVEFEEDEEIDEERFIELQDDEIDKRVTETFEAFFEEMDDDGRDFLKFKKNGGATADFLKHFKDSSAVPKGDAEDEAFQKKFLRYYYETYDEMEPDEIDERLEWLEDAGRLKRYTERYTEKVNNIQQKQKEQMIKQREQAEAQRDKDRETYQKTLRTKLDKAEEIKSFPITPKDKKELFNYITKPVKKVGKNTYISQFQQDMNTVGADFDTLILLAKLVKSDFDVSSIEKKVETKKTRNIKEKLQGQRKTRRPRAGGGTGKKSLSDFFSD